MVEFLPSLFATEADGKLVAFVEAVLWIQLVQSHAERFQQLLKRIGNFCVGAVKRLKIQRQRGEKTKKWMRLTRFKA